MQLIHFFTLNIIFILISVYMVYYFFYKPKNYTFFEFINNSKKNKMSVKKIVVGFVFGIVFGFIDNFGLWIGLTNFQNNIQASPRIKAALGNTYSDMIGAIVGTLVSSIVDVVWKVNPTSEYNNSPLWVTTVSIGIGCILGLFVGRVLLK